MKIKSKSFLITFSVVTVVGLIVLELLLSLFITFDRIRFFDEGLKVFIMIYFFLLLHQFKDRLISLGMESVIIAYIIEWFQILSFPRSFDLILSVMHFSFLFIGFAVLLFGIYRLLNRNAQANIRLKEMALYDALTHLPNRQYIAEQGTSSIIKSDRAVLVFIDIDDFKLINDYAGHAIGDRVLRIFADRLKKCIHEGDTVVRISGDEFIMVVNNVESDKEVEHLALRIAEGMAEPFLIKEREISVHCSIGISLYPEHGKNLDTLIKKADIAMYESKRFGKNRYYIFESSMESQFNIKFEQTFELKKAIKNGEIVPYYQKKANTLTGEITGLEALARWINPQKGVLPPQEFIPLAEEIQVIDLIDITILKQVAKQIKTWITEGIEPYTISVNISPSFFMSIPFLDTIDKILKDYDINPYYINLEITESVALKDFHRTKLVLNALKDRNIKIHMDDFGKGYSSFNYIKEFSFDYIKIDKSFIDGINENKVDPALIAMVIQLSQLLDFRVISEGVETKEQLTFLQQAGCHEFQGYILSKPEPLEHLDLTFKSKHYDD